MALYLKNTLISRVDLLRDYIDQDDDLVKGKVREEYMGVNVSKKGGKEGMKKDYQVVQMGVNEVKPYSNNPRNNQSAIALVRASLREFGFRQPIVVDKNHVIVVGHTRLLAAKAEGYATVPVHVALDLSPAQIQAYRLADNKVGEEATWDEDLLMMELSSLMEQDIDMSSFGFSQSDLADLDKKQDSRWLEDFDVMPTPKPKWILISAPEDSCAEILSFLKELHSPSMKFEYSGDGNTADSFKNQPQ